jgi:cardiolipin synthase
VRSSASVGWDDLQTLFTVLVTSAQQRVRITTAYFAPSTDFVELLIEAAQRGVEVDVLLPGPHADKRVCQIASESEYADLTEGGVTVWNFQPSMLHAKICTVDQVVSVVGSSNFNRRSMDHDEEVVMAVIDRDFTAELDADFEDDLKRSRKISLVRWEDRGLAQRAKEKAVRPIRRWL